MALVNCRECGKEVSTQAKACPHCGARRINRVARAIIGVPLGFFLLCFAYEFNKEKFGQTPAEFFGIAAVVVLAILGYNFLLKRKARRDGRAS
jgi:hypothetical protein